MKAKKEVISSGGRLQTSENISFLIESHVIKNNRSSLLAGLLQELSLGKKTFRSSNQIYNSLFIEQFRKNLSYNWGLFLPKISYFNFIFDLTKLFVCRGHFMVKSKKKVLVSFSCGFWLISLYFFKACTKKITVKTYISTNFVSYIKITHVKSVNYNVTLPVLHI